MAEKIIECEADKTKRYYRVIQTAKKYRDGRRFPIDEMVVSDRKIDLNATDTKEIGGFFVSTYEYIFRWLIRGDTLCEVTIPDESKIYKTVSENGIYLSEKMILTNPIKINDDVAMELYLNSTLPQYSYFEAMAACAIMGYINTAIKVCEDKVNKENIDIAIIKFESFCKRREEENYIDDPFNIESVKLLYDKLKTIKKELINFE